MSNITGNIFFIFIVIAVLVLYLTAFINKNKWLRIVTVIVLNLCIVIREYSIYYFVRNYNFTNKVSEEFSNGAHFVVDYCYVSSIPILIALLFITILCIRGFKQTDKIVIKAESE